MPDEHPGPQNESRQDMQRSPREYGWKVGFLILALSPTPIALLMGASEVLEEVFRSYENHQPLSIGAIVFGIFTSICCLLGGIGLCGGFDGRRFGPMAGGVLVGLALVLVDLFAAVFIGCCAGLSRL